MLKETKKVVLVVFGVTFITFSTLVFYVTFIAFVFGVRLVCWCLRIDSVWVLI